jgi:hypothetical protein
MAPNSSGRVGARGGAGILGGLARTLHQGRLKMQRLWGRAEG